MTKASFLPKQADSRWRKLFRSWWSEMVVFFFCGSNIRWPDRGSVCHLAKELELKKWSGYLFCSKSSCPPVSLINAKFAVRTAQSRTVWISKFFTDLIEMAITQANRAAQCGNALNRPSKLAFQTSVCPGERCRWNVKMCRISKRVWQIARTKRESRKRGSKLNDRATRMCLMVKNDKLYAIVESDQRPQISTQISTQIANCFFFLSLAKLIIRENLKPVERVAKGPSVRAKMTNGMAISQKEGLVVLTTSQLTLTKTFTQTFF